MPIVSISSDPASLTLTAIGEYPVPVERLWAAWTDPRQLERFWGPPQWPATFTRHDLREGGRADYHMTGPAGEVSRGWWVFERVEAPHTLEVRDGFSNPDGSDNVQLPGTRMVLTFESTDNGSRFVSVSHFQSLEALEALVSMGMVEGLTQALGQMDAVLADLRNASRNTEMEVLDDTHVRITRVVRGSMAEVWRAHHEAALVRQWMLGPDGWSMPVCEVAVEVGDSYRYEWEQEDGEGRFGFTGSLLEQQAPRRAVTSEQMIGMEGPGVVNELVLIPRPGNRTEIQVTVTYPSVQVRDMVLQTGMVDGMESSYARLESVLAAAEPALASAGE